MIHRVLIGVLVTGSLALALVGLASLWTEVGRAGPFGSRSYGLIEIEGGNLHVVYARRGERTEPRPSVRYGKTARLGIFGAVGAWTGVNRHNWRWVSLVAPLWLLVTLMIAHPAIVLYRGPIRRHFRRRRNLCPECGYNRMGNISGTCPECGLALAS